LRRQPDRRAANSRIDHVDQLLVLISCKTLRSILALAAKYARHISAQSGYLSLDQAHAPIISRVPAFNAVGNEIPEDGNEWITGQSDVAERNGASASSGSQKFLESNQFVDDSNLKLCHWLDEPCALFQRRGQVFSYPETASMGRAHGTRR
jgi:hypothetical protein